MNDFDVWNIQKQQLNKTPNKIYFFEKEVWILSLGKNIGVELNGKQDQFLRPVLIYKKFSGDQFLFLPLTTKGKINHFYYPLPAISFLNFQSYLMLSQIRVADKKRLIRKLGKISDIEFESIKKSARALLEPQSPNGYNVTLS